MWHRRCYLVLAFLLTSLPALAVGPTEQEARTPHWWLQQALADIGKLKTPELQMGACQDLFYPAADAGDTDVVTQLTAMVERLQATNATLKLRVNPAAQLTRAKVIAFAIKGHHQAALAAIRPEDATLINELIRQLAWAGHTEQLRALAGERVLTPAQVTLCLEQLVEAAARRRDIKTGREVLALLPDQKNLPYMLSQKLHSTVRMDGVIDVPAACFYAELLPDTPGSGDVLASVARTLAGRGYVKEALPLALRVPVAGRRAEALSDLWHGLALDGQADEARALIAKEKDPHVIAQAHYGLAVGLALRNEPAAACAAFAKANRSANDKTFAVAMVVGPMLAEKAQDADVLKTVGDASTREGLIMQTARFLAVRNRLEEAMRLVVAYPDTNFSALQSRGHALYEIALAYRAAKDDAGYQRTVKALDDLLPLAAEKDKRSALNNLVFAHSMLDDSEGMRVFIPAMAAAADRDHARKSLAGVLAMKGDFAAVSEVLDGLETKAGARDFEEIAQAAIYGDHLAALGAWIATWPDAAMRVESYTRIARALPRMNLRRAHGIKSRF